MSDYNVTCGSPDSATGNYVGGEKMSANDGCDNYDGGEKMSDPSPQLEDLTDKLHFDELLKLFSWLTISDLITVKRVCHSWREAAQDRSLWKNHVLTLIDDTLKDEVNLKLMPHIRNIKGEAENSFLNVIMENVTELSELNVEFKPHISASQVTSVLEKYPRLESLKICYNYYDILEILDRLKVSQHLRKVNSYFTFHPPLNKKHASAYSIFKLFADCNNFPALTDLNISDTNFSRELLKSTFRNLVADIITKRSQRLLSLTLYTRELYNLRSYTEDADFSSVFNAVKSCVNLQSLKLYSQDEDCSIVLNALKSFVKLQKLNLSITPNNNCIGFQSLEELKSLYLHGNKSDELFNTSIQNSLERGTWPHLTEIDISLCNKEHKYNVPVLKTIIDRAKHLKRLRYTDEEWLISEEQLEGISNLVKLEHLFLMGLEDFSSELIGYLSECYSLKHLELYSHNYSISCNDPDIIEMFRKLTDLEYVSINASDTVHYFYDNLSDSSDEYSEYLIYLENKEQIKRYVSDNS